MVYLFQLQYAMEHQCFVSCINSWNKENSKYLIPIVSKLFHSNAQEKKKKIKSPLILCKGSLFSACKFNCHYPYILGRLYFLIAIKITLLTKKKKKKKKRGQLPLDKKTISEYQTVANPKRVFTLENVGVCVLIFQILCKLMMTLF